jgi:DNA-binding transcriptional LysR family regulator
MNDPLVSAVSQRPLSGRLRIAASRDFGDEILPRVLQDLSRKLPAIRFEVEVEGGVRSLDDWLARSSVGSPIGTRKACVDRNSRIRRKNRKAHAVSGVRPALPFQRARST